MTNTLKLKRHGTTQAKVADMTTDELRTMMETLLDQKIPNGSAIPISVWNCVPRSSPALSANGGNTRLESVASRWMKSLND